MPLEYYRQGESSLKRRSLKAAGDEAAPEISLSFKNTLPVTCTMTSDSRSMEFWYPGPCRKALP